MEGGWQPFVDHMLVYVDAGDLRGLMQSRMERVSEPTAEPSRMTIPRPDIVLVVDDSPADRASADRRPPGRRHDGHGRGRTARRRSDLATQLRPDIILMDAVMPAMDGFETCRRLKLLSGFDSVPVIFMTGLSEPEDSVRGFEAGGVDYVTKPIVIDDMLARMRVHLANARKIKSAQNRARCGRPLSRRHQPGRRHPLVHPAGLPPS